MSHLEIAIIDSLPEAAAISLVSLVFRVFTHGNHLLGTDELVGRSRSRRKCRQGNCRRNKYEYLFHLTAPLRNAESTNNLLALYWQLEISKAPGSALTLGLLTV
jgi:hypothetical protein